MDKLQSSINKYINFHNNIREVEFMCHHDIVGFTRRVDQSCVFQNKKDVYFDSSAM